jgi:hypothetical protein
MMLQSRMLRGIFAYRENIGVIFEKHYQIDNKEVQYIACNRDSRWSYAILLGKTRNMPYFRKSKLIRDFNFKI